MMVWKGETREIYSMAPPSSASAITHHGDNVMPYCYICTILDWWYDTMVIIVPPY